MKLTNILEQISDDIEQKIDKVKLKNPKTGRDNKLMTAVGNKDNPNHSKAIKMLQNLKGKKETSEVDAEYYDKVIKVLKVIGDDKSKNKIKKDLDKTKTKKQFKIVFRNSIDPEQEVIDDKTLDILYDAYKKNKDGKKTKTSKTYHDDDFDDFRFSKKKGSRKTRRNRDDDYSYGDDYDNESGDDSEVDEKIKDLNKTSLIGLIGVAGLFGGIGKLFQFSSNATIKYLEKFKDAFIDKKDQLKDMFNDYY